MRYNKLKTIILSLLVILLLVNNDVKAQFNTFGGGTPIETMVDNITNANCGTPFNVVINNGFGQQTRLYDNGGFLGTGYGSGVIISTGAATASEPPNDLGNVGNNLGGGANPNIATILPVGTPLFDCYAVSFDVIAASNSIVINYIFASEEYTEWVGSSFFDAVGIFVNQQFGSNTSCGNVTNTALVPNSSLPVTITNISNINNSSLYVNNPPVTGAFYNNIEYDGFTVPLQAVAINVIVGQTYRIQIVICDVGDGLYDSALILPNNAVDCGINNTIGVPVTPCVPLGFNEINLTYNLHDNFTRLFWDYQYSHMWLQKSLDGENFEDIKNVFYQTYTDTVLYNKIFYRIRAIDYDGNEYFSNVVEIDRQLNIFNVYPNPIIDHIYVENNENSYFELYNLEGKLIYNGLCNKNIYLNLSNGLYILKCGNLHKNILINR